VYLAIGLPRGVLVTPNRPEESFGAIRRGGHTVKVSLAVYEWWTLALGGIEPDALHSLVSEHGDPSDPVERVAWMVASRLLLPWKGTADDIKRFSEIRVMLTSVGAGNSSGDLLEFVIQSRQDGTCALRVDFPAYLLWGLCDGTISLEQACQMVAEDLDMPVEYMHHRALWLVPALMRNGLALLDLAAPM